jgi:hypothetical protein
MNKHYGPEIATTDLSNYDENTFTINGKEIEQGEVYTDGINTYWLIGFDTVSKTVSYIKNAPDGMLARDVINKYESVTISLQDFQRFIKGTYADYIIGKTS